MERLSLYPQEELDINFSDTKPFAHKKWEDAVLAAQSTVPDECLPTLSRPRDWQHLYSYVRTQAMDCSSSAAYRKCMNHLIPFPRSLANLLGTFQKSLSPLKADENMLWGLMYLNIKLSSDSQAKLNKTSTWMKRVRGQVELFNRCLDVCEDLNEARYSLVDVLEYILQMFIASLEYLNNDSADYEDAKMLDEKISDDLADMETVIKHLNDITSYSKAYVTLRAKGIADRFAPANGPVEHTTFPISMIPRRRNPDFFGRKEELDRINQHCKPVEIKNDLRTYTIYGRRGVGKTNVALEYAYRNPSGFDAIFWVSCETSLTLRQSFSDMAVALHLPGADRDGHHEENHLAVLNWLKTTRKTWLMIFDNAEKEDILRAYWPTGAGGAILITSRKYYNFAFDSNRKGDTVKPFTEKQGWDLLFKLLGPRYLKQYQSFLIPYAEEEAAKELLRTLGGLALAISQAAQLINSPAQPSSTIVQCLESFRFHKRRLQPRPGAETTDVMHSLDTLWDMTFTLLSRQARDLLSVLSLLSPDRILIDLFLPKRQAALNGKLDFCKQLTRTPNQETIAEAQRLSVPPKLRDALNELIAFKLIAEEGRELRAHRVVQEAMNYHSYKEQQEYFNSASALVFEAFPKQEAGDYLFKQWSACQAYCPHASHLSSVFATYRRTPARSKITGSADFIKLLRNCAWYLYEIGEYTLCLKVVETGQSACGDDAQSLQYAEFLNIAGLTYFEQNKLQLSREKIERYYQIQGKLLPPDSLDRSISLHNMGLVEASSDNLIEAADLFKRAISIRAKAGDKASGLLAISYLCLSRVDFYRKDYDAAWKKLGQAEALYFRTVGEDAQFMAHVHYAYGNILLEQKRYDSAKRSYEFCLKISLQHIPIHPLTVSTYYSLGCVEYEEGRLQNAKGYLDKAMSIAQLRSPNKEDGHIARILWRTSMVLDADFTGANQDEAQRTRARAEITRNTLWKNGEGGANGNVLALDDEGNTDAVETEASYDALVPAYFK